MAEVFWVPLESNPETMNSFLDDVGVPKEWRVHDVYGLDPELLAMLPQPVLSLILLFPSKADTREDRSDTGCPAGVYFMKQVVHNACGTIAMLHAVANNTERISLSPSSKLAKFLQDTKDQDPDERAQFLMNNKEICEAHAQASETGQTVNREIDESLLPHFVAFAHHNGTLYELDGLKNSPIPHGPTSPESFLEDAAKVCRAHMARHPDQINFSLMALAAGY